MIRNYKFEELFDKFNNIVFDEDKHQYTLNGNVLKSVTTYIKDKYIKPFDSWKIASILASKTNKPARYWFEYWKLLGAESSAIGTRVHWFASWYSSTSKPKDAREEAVKAFYDDYISNGWEIVATELCVFNDRLAGTLDLLMWNDEFGFMLIDFKTNKKDLKKDKVEFKDGTNKPLIEQYKMQLAMYEYLLGEGSVMKAVCHITENGYEVIEC